MPKEDPAPEYTFIGLMAPADGGRPLLHQLGNGRLQRYDLRFVSVNSTSLSAAKKIQIDYRKKNRG